MSERVFIDTNILVYADDLDGGEKSTTAQEILRSAMTAGTGVLSTQVLQEFFVVATRKLGVTAEVARQKVELLSRMEVVLIRPTTILGAIDLHRLHGFSLWDCLVLKCANLSGCRRVLTEDMQHGQLVDGVRIENPFRQQS